MPGRSMLNKDFYKLRRDFNPNVVPSVDFISILTKIKDTIYKRMNHILILLECNYHYKDKMKKI